MYYSVTENMSENLNEIEVRILGSLVEKQLATPEYYPLTLNALMAACNQKTNREPVVFYSEQIISQTLDVLREKNLVYVYYGSGSRVPKYKNLVSHAFELEPSETAIICVLFLRGQQTIGEIRERTHRLYDFTDLNDVNESLESLIRRETPLIVKLERQPGQKEVRYAHLLSGEVTAESHISQRILSKESDNERFTKLETEVETLKTEMNELRQTFEEFKKQFE